MLTLQGKSLAKGIVMGQVMVSGQDPRENFSPYPDHPLLSAVAKDGVS